MVDKLQESAALSIPTVYSSLSFFILLSVMFVISSIVSSLRLSVHVGTPEFKNNFSLFVCLSLCLLFVLLFVCPDVCLSSACNTNCLVSYFGVVSETGKKIPPVHRSSTKGNNFGFDISLAPLFLLSENVSVHKSSLN